MQSFQNKNRVFFKKEDIIKRKLKQTFNWITNEAHLVQKPTQILFHMTLTGSPKLANT